MYGNVLAPEIICQPLAADFEINIIPKAKVALPYDTNTINETNWLEVQKISDFHVELTHH